jgi:hypothetical protein
VACILRFAIVKKPVSLLLTLITMIILLCFWIVIYSILQEAQYRPSLLFLLCVNAAFRTLRFEDTTQISPATPIQSDTQDEDQ